MLDHVGTYVQVSMRPWKIATSHMPSGAERVFNSFNAKAVAGGFAVASALAAAGVSAAASAFAAFSSMYNNRMKARSDCDWP